MSEHKEEKNHQHENEEDTEIVFEEELQPVDRVKKLRKELKEVRQEKQEYLLGWQRAQADLVNARKDFSTSKEGLIRFANEELILDLIPILDSFDMAFQNKERWEEVDENWRQGVEYIYSQLTQTLKSRGLDRLGEIGEKFNPEIHVSAGEEEVETSSADGKVSKILQSGYILNKKVIRPARVIIGVFK